MNRQKTAHPQKVIIVGATSGIGKALAALYLEQGAFVGITGRRQALLDQFRDADGASRVFTACFDVTAAGSVNELAALVDRMGGMDLFLYNAGFGDPSETLDPAVDEKTVAINVTGFVAMANWAYHYFERQGHGQLAATSSIASNRGNSFAPAYSASKAFISNYLEGLYFKARKRGLATRITDIQPGFVKTKEINLKGLFWVVPLDKAARQIMAGLESHRFRVYVSRRWWLIAKLMRLVPASLYGKIA
jgi:short-subunit dehydrogenase